MSKKNKKEYTLEDLEQLKPEEKMKWEVAKEIGLFDKVLSDGWRSLSAKESGRIGGIMANRKKKLCQNKMEQPQDSNQLE